MSRMRKQDEMENLRLENERLTVDKQHLENEIQRLRDELTNRPFVPPSTTFNPAVKNEFEHRPMTPPDSYQDSTSPQPVPSLAYTSSPSGSSLDLDEHTATQKPLFADNTAFGPFTVDPTNLKQSDDSRSAEACSQQWTLDSHQISAVSQPHRRSQRVRVRQDQIV